MTINIGIRASAIFYDCDLDIFSNEDGILDVFVNTLQASGFHVVSKLAHTFNPHGITCMVVLSESHAILHTWPEYRVMIVDVFVCDGNVQLQKALKTLGDKINSSRIEISSKEIHLEV